VYAEEGVVFLGIEKGIRRPSFSGNIRDPIDFIEQMEWSFPSGIDLDKSVYSAYTAEMDQYMVIGKDGHVFYVSPVVGFEEGAIDVPAIADAIEDALLGRVPVKRTTWSRIKLLWSR